MLCIKVVDIRQMFKKKKYPNLNAGSKVPLSDCSPEGKEIIELLNKYREENGLPKIPKSCSLCTVANTKVVATHLKSHFELKLWFNIILLVQYACS